MIAYPYHGFRHVIPLKNEETGEICDDLMCIKCNVNGVTNEETGEVEKTRNTLLFKVQRQQKSKERINFKNLDKWRNGCSKCSKRSLMAMIINLTLVMPSVVVFLYVAVETLLHLYQHKRKSKKYMSFRTKLHHIIYAQFCAVCQAERSMAVIGKLQDERLAKMRKYVQNLPFQ